jgi:Xaa-His dipeptidase
MSFAEINEVMQMPNLIEIQKNSYEWFLYIGLREVFRDIDEITDYTGNLVLTFIDYRMDEKPKYSVAECKERDATYSAPLRVLARLYEENPFRLVSIEGGNKRNAIPRECVAQLVTNEPEALKESIKRLEKEIKAALVPEDKAFCIRVDKGATEGTVISYKQTSAVINCMTLAHNGVYANMQDGSGFVRTSASMGVVTTCEDKIEFNIMARSSNDGEMDALILSYKNLAKAIDAEFTLEGKSSGWDFDPESRLAKDFVRIYKELFGEDSDPKVNPIHAGLECGVIVSVLGEGCDALSIGPTIVDIHTPDERLELASCEKFWKLLCAMVAAK